jgi:predicted metal-dependent phosphoesterase TrpH
VNRNDICDLHTHTYYSDGLLSPESLVRAAAAQGIGVLAITDHENVRGSREAEPVARKLGVELIPAVELASGWAGYGWPEWGMAVDVLGYFINPDEPAYRALERAMYDAYCAQLAEALEEVTRLGYAVSLDEATRANPTYPSIFSALEALKQKGMVHDETAAFDVLASAWREVCYPDFDIARVIEGIHIAGGVAVLAHPAVVFRPDGGMLQAEDVALLVEMGLDGIEVYHYRLPDAATRQHFSDLARRFDLVVSGGSDEHARPNGISRLGTEPVTRAMVDALRARCR